MSEFQTSFGGQEVAASATELTREELVRENEILRQLLEQSEISRLCDPDINFVLNKPGMQLAFEDIKKKMHDDDNVLLLFLDLDNFKEVNTIAGHIGADDILAGYANFLVGQTRGEGDAVARHGGDEFVLMVNLDGIADYTEFLKRIAQKVVLPYTAPSGSKQQYTISSSIGVTLIYKDSDYMDALQAADSASAFAKASGRGGSVALQLPGCEASLFDFSDKPVQTRVLDTRS